MLQIISGKFFTNPDRHSFPARAVLYSNFHWIRPIQTCVGILEPVDSHRAASTYVFSYTNQIESAGARAGAIVRTGDAEISRQFQLLCILGLRGYFHPDRAAVLLNCRTGALAGHDSYVPSHFADRVLDAHIDGEMSNETSFSSLAEKVIALPRDRYEAVMAALNNLEHALQALNWNLDLAYSMLVYCLESLAQTFDKFIPSWDDIDERVQKSVDGLSESAPKEAVDAIRHALLSTSHQRLNARFLDFIEQHVPESFFTAARRESRLRKTDLRRALKNSYQLRSKYVHQLTPIREQLHHSFVRGEVFHWEREIYLSFRGLQRIVFSVLEDFIAKSPSIPNEEFDWWDALPGKIKMYPAPQYWIHQDEDFQAMKAPDLLRTTRRRLAGLLSMLHVKDGKPAPLPDMRTVLTKYQDAAPRAKPEARAAMLATYRIWNALMDPSLRISGWEAFSNRFPYAIAATVEDLLTELLVNDDAEGDYKSIRAVYDKHHTGRYSTDLDIPTLIEAKLICFIAEKALAEGLQDEFLELIERGVGHLAGFPELQRVLIEAKDTKAPVDHRVHFIVVARPPRQPPDAMEIVSDSTSQPGSKDQ